MNIDLSRNVGINKDGKAVYGFEGCYRYCVEPTSGKVYLTHEDNTLEETKFFYMRNISLRNTGEVLSGVVLDRTNLYIGGNKLSKTKRMGSTVTSFNGHEYVLYVAKGNLYNPEVKNDLDISEFLNSLDKEYADLIKLQFGRTTAEGEFILFIKFRGHATMITVLDQEASFKTLPLAASTRVEKELGVGYINGCSELIYRIKEHSFDESSVIDIRKEDADYCFNEIEKYVHTDISRVVLSHITSKLGLSRHTLGILRKKINLGKNENNKNMHRFLFYQMAYGYLKGTLSFLK